MLDKNALKMTNTEHMQKNKKKRKMEKKLYSATTIILTSLGLSTDSPKQKVIEN